MRDIWSDLALLSLCGIFFYIASSFEWNVGIGVNWMMYLATFFFLIKSLPIHKSVNAVIIVLMLLPFVSSVGGDNINTYDVNRASASSIIAGLVCGTIFNGHSKAAK